MEPMTLRLAAFCLPRPQTAGERYAQQIARDLQEIDHQLRGLTVVAVSGGVPLVGWFDTQDTEGIHKTLASRYGEYQLVAAFSGDLTPAFVPS